MASPDKRWVLGPFSLVTEQLTVRAFTQADIVPEYLGWLNDRQYMRYSNQRFHGHTQTSVMAYLSDFDSARSAFLALELRATRQLAGTATVFASPEHGTADIGILIGSQFQGRGLAREAVGSIADALADQGFRKVTIGTSAKNVGMRRVIEALDFEPDGVKARHELIDGEETDVVYFARFTTPQDA